MTLKQEEYNRFKQVCVIKNNAKQKAEELVWNFGKSINKLEMTYSQAKQCALIAVDEILNSRPVITGSQFEFNKYWEKVKQEIINL